MKNFKLKSGTNVTITEDKVIIEKKSSKSVYMGLRAKDAVGLMIIKLSSISNIIFDVNYLMLCGIGLPTPTDFRDYYTSEIVQYPNCIEGDEADLRVIYNHLALII